MTTPGYPASQKCCFSYGTQTSEILPKIDTVNGHNLTTQQRTAFSSKPLPLTPALALRRGCWSIPSLGHCLPSATLDVLGLSSGTTGLLASDVHLRMGLRQVGGSSNEVCPSLTSEFESPLKSDSRSELQERSARSSTCQRMHSMEIFITIQCNKHQRQP